MEARQRQEVLLLQTEDGILADHQDLQGGQGLEPAAVDGHQPVGVQVKPEGGRTIKEPLRTFQDGSSVSGTPVRDALVSGGWGYLSRLVRPSKALGPMEEMWLWLM